ncbi:MAG: uroporphyrinogen-III C-methyltransferase [Myxococcota bacterium]
MKTGKVLLVGAGPGAPDLITLRGAQALRNADAVVYDALASPRLLELAPADAVKIDVGKRGHDAPTRTQAETTALLLELAREGRTVVRLKGGDPYVFGRGGEEAGACAEAGIPFEVIPGVSSIFGALAYAGIPITDRRHAASFAVVTGHKDPTKVAEETRWDLLAHAADTLLILMGMRNLATLVARLLEAGRDPETPAAAVMSGTLPQQRVVEAPLGELVGAVDAAGLGAPSIIAVGSVVSLREALSWWERQPLFGSRVLVTRSPDQAGPLLVALESAGAEPVSIPMLALRAVADPAPLDAALARLDDFDAVVFTSANAVRFTAERHRERFGAWPPHAVRVICIGPKTADAALAAGLPVHAVPASRFDAESVVAALVSQDEVAGRRFLLPGSDLARPQLREGLAAAGGEALAVVAYQNRPAAVDVAALRADLLAERFDALTFASPSAVHHFWSHLDDEVRAAAARVRVGAIGPATASAVVEVGLAAPIVAQVSTAEGLVDALAHAWHRDRSD